MISKINILVILIALFLFSCNKEERSVEPVEVIEEAEQEEVNETANCTLHTANSEALVNGDQLPIVAGKLLSYVVSTEDECAYTPPGKWVNVYGMVYYRYVERGTGDTKLSVSGLNKESAEIVASILNTEQLDKLMAIIPQQVIWENQARNNRDMISRELYKWKSGAAGDENLILSSTNENGVLLKDITHQRTSVYGNIFNELTGEQKDNFCLARTSIENIGVNPDDLKNLKNQLNSEGEKIALNLILSKFFAWATGTEEMNQLVDDGRPAVYFGFANLRVEDREGEDVSNGLRKEASDLILNTLNAAQRANLENLVAIQTNYLESYFSTRADLASSLMDYREGNVTVDLNELLTICTNSEMAESQLGILEAQEMGAIIQSMDDAQLQILIDFKEGN